MRSGAEIFDDVRPVEMGTGINLGLMPFRTFEPGRNTGGPRVRWPSIDSDGAQCEARLAGGDPDRPITKHHPFVPDENRLEA